jgi:hypothetical protein
MMQSVFKCDKCKKEIGAKPHITLSFGNSSGIAIPPSKDEMVKFQKGFGNVWKVHEKLQGKFMHFCSTEHLKMFFDELMKRATDKV